MRRVGASIGLAVSVILGAACGGGGGGASKVTTAPPQAGSTSAPSKGKSSQTAVDGALLTLSDFPAGFATTPQAPSSSTTAVCGLQNYRDKALAHAEVDFQRQVGPRSVTVVSDTVDAFPAGLAKTALDQVQAGLRSCTTFTTNSNGAPITFQVSPLSFPRLADQTLALRLTGQIRSGSLQGSTLPVDVIIIRAGNNLAVVGNGGLNSIDTSLSQALARRQADKLAAL